MNFRCVIITLFLIAGMGAAWGSSDCESTKSNQAFNACLIKSLSADFLSSKVDNGRWVYSLRQNTKDEGGSVFVATLLSSSKIHYLDKPVAMTVRCGDKKTELEIHWDGVKIKEGGANISYYLNKETSHPAKWSLSVAQQSVFVSDPGSFIQTLATKKVFRIQIASPNSPLVSATFYLNGLSNLLPEMKNVCF